MKKLIESLKLLAENSPEDFAKIQEAFEAGENGFDMMKAVMVESSPEIDKLNEDDKAKIELIFESTKDKSDKDKDKDEKKSDKDKDEKKSDKDDDDKKSDKDDKDKDEKKSDKDDDKKSDKDDDKKKDESVKTVSIVDNETVNKMIESLGVGEEQAASFIAVLKTEIARVATEVSKNAVLKIEKNYEQKLEANEESVETRVTSYLERATNEFYESHGDDMVDKDRLSKLETLFEDTRTMFSNTDFEISVENSSLIDDLRSDLQDKKDYIENLSTENDKSKKETLLMKIERFIENESSDMTDSDRERFVESAGEVDFHSFEDFKKKTTSIKKQFFSEDNEDKDYLRRIVEHTDENDTKIDEEAKGDIYSAITEVMKD